MPIRPQLRYNIRGNNSQLTVRACEGQVRKVYDFCQNFKKHEDRFINICAKIAPQSSLSVMRQVTKVEQFSALIEEIVRQGYCILDVVSDHINSYKGFVSFVIIGFHNRAYIVDALVLRQEMKKLKQVIQNIDIVKFCFRLTNTLEEIKREWSAFGANFFDFELLEKVIGVKKKYHPQLGNCSERPISQHIIEQFQERYDSIIKITARLPYFLEQEEQAQKYPFYAYSNHYEYLLKDYTHKIKSFEEEEKQFMFCKNEARKKYHEDKQNKNLGNLSGNEFEEYLNVVHVRDKYLGEMLINWREHMARMADQPAWKIVSFEQLIKITVTRPSSILQVQDILEHTPGSLQIASKILEIIALENQLHQNSSNELQMKPPRRTQKDEKSIRTLLQQLKWQGREEWLNRKNDESIKLYKEIVSIDELDGSVISQFTDGIGEGIVGVREIGRFIKYAECFRNGNHKKLKEMYEGMGAIEGGASDDGWDEEEDDFITGRPISKSQTSITDLAQKMQKCDVHTLSSSRSPSSINLLSQIDINSYKIDPLPQNIEEIYLKAATVKKGYQKIQKKKGGRREGKEQDKQFIPSEQDILYLLQM